MRRVPSPNNPPTDQFARSPLIDCLIDCRSGTRMRRVPSTTKPIADQFARSPLIDCLIDW
jgi:hypothetical protein